MRRRPIPFADRLRWRPACSGVRQTCRSSGPAGAVVQADVLSDVLRTVSPDRRGSISFRVESAVGARGAAVARHRRAGHARRATRHRIPPGGRRLRLGHVVGQVPFRLHEGDLIVFPQGDAHGALEDPGMRDALSLAPFSPRARRPSVMSVGGGGPDRARVVCCSRVRRASVQSRSSRRCRRRFISRRAERRPRLVVHVVHRGHRVLHDARGWRERARADYLGVDVRRDRSGAISRRCPTPKRAGSRG